MERRAVHEVRAEGRRLIGYAARFGIEARIGDFSETIRAGAFANSLDRDVLGLVDHDPTRLLGRTRTGTLRLQEDRQGLAFELDVPDTTLGRDVLAMAERGDLGGMSFGFTVPRGGEQWQGRQRELTRVDLLEVSVVHAWPAYDGTSVDARQSTPRRNHALRVLEVIQCAG